MLRRRSRCHHRSRLLNLPCLRPWVYDYWCGHHNGACWWHTMDRNRCPLRGEGRYDPVTPGG